MNGEQIKQEVRHAKVPLIPPTELTNPPMCSEYAIKTQENLRNISSLIGIIRSEADPCFRQAFESRLSTEQQEAWEAQHWLEQNPGVDPSIARRRRLENQRRRLADIHNEYQVCFFKSIPFAFFLLNVVFNQTEVDRRHAEQRRLQLAAIGRLFLSPDTPLC